MPDGVGLGQHKPTSLRGIAYKAKAERSHRFGDLYRSLDGKLLIESWGALNKRSSSGVDKVTSEEYGRDLEGNIHSLVERLKAKRYRARLVRRQYIPKANGKPRPLGIPVLEDKLVQKAASKVLEAIYEPGFLPSSFGYRPGVGAKDAVRVLTFNLQYGSFGYVVEADIKGFFNNLDHEWLKRMLRERIADEAFIGLIGKWLKAGILDTDGRVHHPVTGSPQGGVVSPVLANIYLHYVLDLWFEGIVKRRCLGKAMLCRYADDFVCAFQYRSDAEAFYRELPERLKKFNLDVALGKTRMLRFSRFHPGLERRFSFLGFEFYWDLDRKGERRLMKRTDRRKLRSSIRNFTAWVKEHRHLRTRLLFAAMSQKLRGYYNYYGVPGNSRSVQTFHNEAMKILMKWLRRRSRTHRMNGWRFYELLEVPLPRIIPWSRKPNPVLS